MQQQNAACVAVQPAPTVKIAPTSLPEADERLSQPRTGTDESTVVANQQAKSGNAKKVEKRDKVNAKVNKTAVSLKLARKRVTETGAESAAKSAPVSLQVHAEARRQPRPAQTRVALPASLGDPAFIKAAPVKRIDPEILECVYFNLFVR